MVTIASLWLPILLSAVFVWIASAIVWTVMPHHKKDWKPLPDEDATQAALRPQDLSPGQYTMPFVGSSAAMKDPDVARKLQQGPVGYLTIIPSGMPTMGGKMVASFVFYVVVAAMVAYLASRTLAPGAEYLKVFQITGTVAWLTYAFAIVPESIWFGRPWSVTIKTVLDGLAYSLLTAGTFGWLWPGM